MKFINWNINLHMKLLFAKSDETPNVSHLGFPDQDQFFSINFPTGGKGEKDSSFRENFDRPSSRPKKLVSSYKVCNNKSNGPYMER